MQHNNGRRGVSWLPGASVCFVILSLVKLIYFRARSFWRSGFTKKGQSSNSRCFEKSLNNGAGKGKLRGDLGQAQRGSARVYHDLARKDKIDVICRCRH